MVQIIPHAIDQVRHEIQLICANDSYSGMAGYKEEFFTLDERDKRELVMEPATTVLLGDVISDLVAEEERRVTIVMKMDIEFMECKAILGSPEIFKNEKASSLQLS